MMMKLPIFMYTEKLESYFSLPHQNSQDPAWLQAWYVTYARIPVNYLSDSGFTLLDSTRPRFQYILKVPVGFIDFS